MELIVELSDKTFGLKPIKVFKWNIRRAARTVILNEKREVVMVHARKFDYYKIPGGGIEGQESIIKAVQREALEETGYRIKVIKPIGLIMEYRSKIKLLQISYCFLSHTVGKQKKPQFTGSEKAERFEPITIKNVSQAISLMKKDKKLPYLAKFMVMRDSAFLQKTKSITKQ